MRLSVNSLYAFALLTLVVLMAPSAAGAQISGQGSPLTSTANYPYNCDVRWMPGYGNNPGGFGPGGYQDFIAQDFYAYYGIRSTCTIFQTGNTAANSHIVPNSGKVTIARVKSGPNPAPISIATFRQFTGVRQSDQQLVTTCCQGVSVTPVVNLTPNGITEIPVNLLVESKPYDPQNPKVAGYRDWVGINIESTSGTLPIHDSGLPRPITPQANDPGGTWYFPHIAPSATNQNAFIANGFEVLMNYDWVPTEATTPGDPAPTTPSCPNAAWTDRKARAAACAPAAKPALTQIRSSKLKLKRGKVGVSVKCLRTDKKACKGKVRLRTAAKKPVLLASTTLNVSAGKTKSVSVSLNSKARKRLKGKSKVRVEIAIAGQPTVTKDVKLGS